MAVVCSPRPCSGQMPASATPLANHSTSNMLDCVHTNRTLLQVPFGLTATALVTKADGPVAQCFATIGSLSLGQVRWVMSGLSDAALAAEGLDLASIAPNDDGDTAREWRPPPGVRGSAHPSRSFMDELVDHDDRSPSGPVRGLSC